MRIPFLQKKSGESEVKKPVVKKSRVRKVFFIFFIIVLVLLPFGVSLGLVWNDVQAAKAELNLAVTAVSEKSFPIAETHIAKTESLLNQAAQASAVWTLFRPLPWIGNQVNAVQYTLVGSARALEAIRLAVQTMSDVVQSLGEARGIQDALVHPEKLFGADHSLTTLSTQDRRAILQKFLDVSDRMQQMEIALASADASVSNIQSDTLATPLRDTLMPVIQRIHDSAQTFSSIAPLVTLLPRIGGYPTPKKYLFFFANNTELRPGGGFLGSFGVLHLQDANITSFVSDDVYTLDNASSSVHEEPPVPLKQYLGVKQWYLRDANWSPDFSVDAQTELRLYNQESGVKGTSDVQGVIQITPDVAVKLLALVQPITIRGVTFTSENMVSTLEYQVEQGFLETGIPVTERKAIMGELIQELLHRLESLPISSWQKVAEIIQGALEQKQIMLYETDPALQTLLEKQGWAGRVLDAGGDYLSVVDANLGALKTDQVMDRSVSYDVSRDAKGSLIATVKMTYKNNGGFTPFTTRYRTYTRVYAPSGSVLVDASGQLVNDKIHDPAQTSGKIDVGSELGKTVFGFFTAVEPGETRTVTMKYTLPTFVSSQIQKNTYKLLVQKQLGTDAVPLTIAMHFGKKVQHATPPEDAAAWGDTNYTVTTTLLQDKYFQIGF